MYRIPAPAVAAVTALVDHRLTGAACAGHAPLFDPPDDEEPPDGIEARLTRATAICRTCPVRDACATAAADQHDPAGIWAGRMYP